MKRYRRLRKLVPDPALFRRRARGETFRELAGDYGVSHTALSRYFARPEARGQLKQAKQLLLAERRLERELRRKARRQVVLERQQLRRSRAVQARIAARRPAGQGAYADWLDERDLRRPLTRAELYSRTDDTAAHTVDRGGGIEAVAQGETLRRLACDYGVAHTTLGRYFARPQVARQLKQTRRQTPTRPPAAATPP